MNNCKLPSVLIKLWNDGKTGVYKSTGKPFRKAYMPFITKLTTMLLDLSKRSSEVADLLSKEPQWEAYINTEYKATINNENRQLGGGHDKKDSEDEPISPEVTEEMRPGDGLMGETKYESSEQMHGREEEGENKEKEEDEVELQLPTKEEKQAKQEMDLEEKKAEEPVTAVAEVKKEVAETKPTVPVSVEEPLQSEYAANNYWRPNMDPKDIDNLALDYA